MNTAPHIVTSLSRALGLKKERIEIVGSTNLTFLAWLFKDPIEASPKRPILIICNQEKTVKDLIHDLGRVAPEAQVISIESFDESPYSGLYPSNHVVQSRTHFLWRAARAKKNEIFIGSVEALLQKTIPLDIFSPYEVVLRKGDEIDIDMICKQLVECGYVSSPLVEDGGAFSRRGDILDIFSPAHAMPLRIEFFGDQIESLRIFDPSSQRSEAEIENAIIIPAKEIILSEDTLTQGRLNIKKFCTTFKVSKENSDTLLEPLKQRIFAHGLDYWLPYFYENPPTPIDAFKEKPLTFWIDELDVMRAADGLENIYHEKFQDQIHSHQAVPEPEKLYEKINILIEKTKDCSVFINKINFEQSDKSDHEVIASKVFDTSDLSTITRAARESKKDFLEPTVLKMRDWQLDGYRIFVWAGSQTQAQRLQYLFETHGQASELVANDKIDWSLLLKKQDDLKKLVHIIPSSLTYSFRAVDEKLVFIREEDIFGSRSHREVKKTKGSLESRTNALSFGDLNPGDFIVHTLHGVGVYEGLKKIPVQGVDAEFIQLKYKDGDKLYLPVFRIAQIQKYASQGGVASVDKLGSTSWLRAKVKVRNALKDVASELLELYAKRARVEGYAFPLADDEFREFEGTFPYDETPDQAKAIDDVTSDMEQPRPMDRLVCGDVGFGKTEVAIRAAFKAVQAKKQVAVLVPTTVLAFQHFQNFKKRFSNTAVSVGVVSRFSPPSQIKKDLTLASEGKLDILIGTHRLLSKDVDFKDLGLLVVDEEQRFGVTHKEKIKRLRSQVDVLTLSATPIPRTLNMALMGVRDLSIINTPPEDRLSIRTFISRYDEEIIKKAITSEIARGGQIYFIHNRVQSIYGFADQIKGIVPDARVRIGHGQLPAEELEKTMLDFYNHEFDVLICTTIIESGLDIPLANTIIIDRADTFGLSQLYQLRGRVGRSKERAYAYLLIPPQGVIDKTAQERLKILQENTELGSGFHIAHHDLELRGSGNILGDNQSGHIAAVGYELYMELLEQALSEAKGEDHFEEEVEPEINLRISALIPDSYIEDIRIRLAYYKALSDIKNESDLDRIELELVDRFGQVPEQVTNLFGVMMIRRVCKELGVKDISSGTKNLSLLFSNTTKVKPDAVIRLATESHKKYQVTPDQSLIIRLNSTTWPSILEELKNVKKILL
jgi:transcription-repair coupling factor (superfamily II helicase)